VSDGAKLIIILVRASLALSLPSVEEAIGIPSFYPSLAISPSPFHMMRCRHTISSLRRFFHVMKKKNAPSPKTHYTL